MARVLVATPEPIAERVAGPAIRAAHIARVLGRDHEVTLVSLHGPSTSPIDGIDVDGPDAIVPDRFDAAVVQGSVLVRHQDLAHSGVPLVVDWFDPFHLEALHRGGDDNILRGDLVEGARQALSAQAARGDFFLCSNRRQRDHWLGWLASAGRLDGPAHEQDPTFEELLAVAPFGIDQIVTGEQAAAAREHSPLHAAFPQIGPDDPILVWSGGLHDWLDPVTVVEAMPTVLHENPDSRLVFLAGPHPNTSLETMGVRGRTIAAARDLRLFGKHVLFVNQWVPYQERLAWLAPATVGVIAHHEHLETRFSHRTRLLDHLAVGLPTVSTSGDPASALLVAGGAAKVVAPGQPELLGAAVAGLIRDRAELAALGAGAASMAPKLRWEHTLDPLIRWMRAPRRAADSNRRRPVEPGADDAGTVERLIGRTQLHWDDGGFRQVVNRSVAAARRRLER